MARFTPEQRERSKYYTLVDRNPMPREIRKLEIKREFAEVK